MRFLALTKRKTLKLASLLLLGAFAMPAFSQDAPAPKIAVLDMAKALFDSERAKAVDAQIEQETAEDKAKLTSIQEQAKAINDRVTADAAVMSDEEKRKAQTDLQDLSVQYQTVGERVNALLEQRRQEFQQQHTQALIQAIQQVIEEGQYTMVIRAEAALHFDPSFDITARVTEKLNLIP
jgi:outer membrane protein